MLMTQREFDDMSMRGIESNNENGNVIIRNDIHITQFEILLGIFIITLISYQ
jgi:hypothetical protein